MIVAQPGSGSQRNAERNGFRIAYTRTKWRLVDEITSALAALFRHLSFASRVSHL